MAHRAASGSDYHLTGLIRCPRCGKAIHRHPRHRPHPPLPLLHLLLPHPLRHHRLRRPRLDADAVDTAVLQALIDFYRTQPA